MIQICQILKNQTLMQTLSGRYPAAMAGAGYVLNAGLVHRWCTDDREMVAARTLWSEDQAVGTWVDHEARPKWEN